MATSSDIYNPDTRPRCIANVRMNTGETYATIGFELTARHLSVVRIDDHPPCGWVGPPGFLYSLSHQPSGVYIVQEWLEDPQPLINFGNHLARIFNYRDFWDELYENLQAGTRNNLRAAVDQYVRIRGLAGRSPDEAEYRRWEATVLCAGNGLPELR